MDNYKSENKKKEKEVPFWNRGSLKCFLRMGFYYFKDERQVDKIANTHIFPLLVSLPTLREC